MPQAIAAVLVNIGVSLATATAIATAVTAIAVSTAFAYGASRYAKNQAKNAYKNRALALDQNIRSAAQPQVVVYGTTAVGSMIAYANTKRVTGSSDNFELWFVDVHAGHECEDITDLYYDSELLTDASHIDWGNNRVDAGPYGITTGGEYAVKVWKQLGTSTQAVISQLDTAFSDIDTNFRGRGICYTVHRFTIFSTSKTLWEQRGAPSVRRALIKGKKDIYDPRLDTSPGANPSSPTYQAWTDNPILCIADAMRTYGGIDAARIDWDSVVAEANICDVLVPVPPAASPSNFQKRYTLNGAFSLGETFQDILDAMLTSCLGSVYKAGGKWRILAGAYRTPDVTLTEADIVGEVTEVTNVSSRDRYNSVRGTFIDASESYIERTYSPVSPAALVTRDNGRTLWREFPLPFTVNDFMAQRIAYKLALQSEHKLTLTVPVRWTGLKVTPHTTVTLSYGPYASKVFRCVNWRMGGDKAPFELVLREETASNWDDLTVGGYTTKSAAGTITKGDYGPPPVTGLTVTPGLGGNLVKWTLPTAGGIESVRVYASPSSAWGSAVLVSDRLTTEYFHRTSTAAWYWIRTVKNGEESLREPNSDTSTATGTPLTEPEPGATVGSPNNYPFVETFSDNNLARVQSWWSEVADIGGDESIVNESGTPALMGGRYVYELGNNSGDDEVSRALDRARAIPVEAGVLYRMSWHFRRSAGATNQVNLGIAGLTADRTTWVNTSGADSLASQHYCVASGHQPGDTAWATRVGYFMRTGAAATGGEALNSLAPAILHTNAHYVVPVFYANYDNQAGTYQIGYVDIERVGTAAGGSTVISDILTNTVVGDGQLADGTGVEDGTIYRQAAKGVAIGTAFDGDAVTFPQAWSSIPDVVFGSGGVTTGASGAFNPAIEYRYTSLQTINSTTYATLTGFGTESERDGGGAGGVTFASGEYTVTDGGTWLVTFSSTWNNESASALPYYIKAQYYNGSTWTDITGSEVRDGSLNATNEQWSHTTMVHLVDFGVGHKIRFQARVESGGDYDTFGGRVTFAKLETSGGQLTQSFNAENLSTTGFTARLKLKELVGSTTLRTDSTVSNPGSPSGVDQSINKGQTDEAYDDKYTFQLDVTVTNSYEPELGGYLPGQVQVGFYTNDGGGWVLRATQTYYGSTLTATKTYTNVTKQLTVDGLGLNDDFGISILVDWFGGSTINFDQVTYYTASAPATETATPTGSDPVSYTVVG